MLLIGVAAALLAWFLLKEPAPLREGDLTGLPARFMQILPGDLSDAQRVEIGGLLKRFQTKANSDQIRAEDYQELMTGFATYLDKGSITRDELNIFMAKVGYYSYRASSPDSSDIHPLLSPTEAPTDTVE